MQQRYYDPIIGRFMGNDPIGFRDVYSFNRYAYANNNPYRYVDPDGENALAINGMRMMAVPLPGARLVGAALLVGAGVQVITAYNESADEDVNSNSCCVAENTSDDAPGQEMEDLLDDWDKGSFDSVEDSVDYHAEKHGDGDKKKYLRKARNFNKKGARKKHNSDGTTTYKKKDGEFKIERNGKTVTYGKN